MQSPTIAAALVYNWIRVTAGYDPRMASAALFDITHRCNLRCSYCYVSKESNECPDGYDAAELSLPDVRRVLGNARKISLSVTFCGGEPFIRKDFASIVDHARDLGFLMVNSFSNGTRLRKDLDIIRKLNLLYVSYDRTRAKQYPEISERVLHDTRYVRNTLGTAIVMVATVTPDDGYEDFLPLLRYVEELGLKLVLQPVRINWCVDDFSWFNGILEKTVEDFGGKMLFNTRRSYSHDDIARCRPKLVLYINCDGTVAYPCERFMSRTSGSLLTDEPRTLWQRGLERYGEFPSEQCAGCGMTCWWDGMDNFKAPWRLDFLRF